MVQNICPSCGGTEVKSEGYRLSCTHCSQLYFRDEVGSYLASAVPFRIGEDEAADRIMSWASSVSGGREFSRNIELAKMRKGLYPIYVFTRTKSGASCRIVASGIPTSEAGVRTTEDVEGEIQQIEQNSDLWSILVTPTVSPLAYERQLMVDAASRKVLFYPFWSTQYVYRGRLNVVTVDGCTGRVAGDISVEREQKRAIPANAVAFALTGATGFLALFSWMAAIIAFAGIATYIGVDAFERRHAR